MNNVITGMRKNGLLEYSSGYSKGREKAFVLSQKGEFYARPFLASLDTVESDAVEQLGADKLQALTELLLEYDEALSKALEEKRKR